MDSVLMLWYIYYTAYAYIYSPYPASQSILRLTFLLVTFYSTSYILRHNKHYIKTISILIIAICFAECLIGVYQLINGQSRNNLYPLTGTLLNPGPYGILLSCGLLMYIGAIRKDKTIYYLPQYIRSTIIFLFACMIIATGSRTSIIAFLVCLAYMFRHYAKTYIWSIVPGFLVLTCVLYFHKQESADGRIVMYVISIYNIIQHPIFGSGIGSFLHQHATGSADLSHLLPTSFFFNHDVITTPFNLPLYIGVEQGGIGILFLFLTIAVTIKPIKKCDRTIKLLIPLLTISTLFSYTFEILSFQLLAVFSLAVVSQDDKPVIVLNKKAVISVFSLFFILTASSFEYIMPRAEANSEYSKTKGRHTEFQLKRYHRLLPLMYDTPSFLFDYAQMLSAHNCFNDSNDILRKGQLVCADPMFYILQANNYVKLHEYAIAELHYKKAYSMMPNRIYPLYKLMKLYIESSQRGKAVMTAERIINFRVKIESIATRQIRQEAKDFLLHAQQI